MSGTVFDASVLVKLVVVEQWSERSVELYDAARGCLIPAHAVAEVAQTLWKKARRGELTPGDALERLMAAQRLDFRVVASVPIARHALAIALDRNDSVYDCVYIATAITEEASLVTADATLATIAECYGVPVALIGALPRP